jgi:hypothetical protein
MTYATTANAEPRFRCGQKTVPPLIAFRTPFDRHGQYLIEVAGASIKTRYPANRMAKALSLADLTGELAVYGPSADGERTILCLTVDIEKYGSRQMTETDAGSRWLAWTPNSLAPLHNAGAKLKRLLVDAQKQVVMGEDPTVARTALPAQSFQRTANQCRWENAPEDQS